MADLGTIGVAATSSMAAVALRGIRIGYDFLVLGGLDSSVGNSAPSLRLDGVGTWSCYVPLVIGDNSVSVDVMQVVNQSPRPTLVVKANPDIGINTDQTGTAGSGTGWVTITITLTATAEGVVLVELHNNLDVQYGTGPCYWDNLNTVP